MTPFSYKTFTEDDIKIRYSARLSDDDYMKAAHRFLQKLMKEFARLSMKCYRPEYESYNMPFYYSERRLDSVVLPALSNICDGIVLTEMPVERKERKTGETIGNGHGRADYWCIFDGYTFIIEMKGSHARVGANYKIRKNSVVNRWKSMVDQLESENRTLSQINREMYDLACDFGMSAGAHSTSIRVSGLSENIPEAAGIMEKLIFNAVPDEAILANCKADIIKLRSDNKSDQGECMEALERYMFYGPEFIKNTTISNGSLMALTSEELIAKVQELAGKGHEILYYGPESQSSVKKMLNENHKVGENPEVLEEKFSKRLTTEKSEVLVAPYESKQFNYIQYADLGGNFDKAATPEVSIFNEYFGSGMNSIVFQEMREARGLAYSAYGYLSAPSDPVNGYMFFAYIASQNDKLRAASEGFKEIIENMPESESAFEIAKEGLLSRMRTYRTTGKAVLDLYRKCRRLGLDEPTDKIVFESVQNMTLEDVKAAQQKWVKGKNYVYGILGDTSDLDYDFLKTLGPVKNVSLEEIFGY